MPFGVDANGFTKKTLEDVKRELEEDQLSNISPELVLASNQFIGQLNAAFSKKVAEIWEVAEVVYNGFDRQASEGRQLDNIGALTLSPREAARKTKVLCTLNLGASFSQPAGALMANVANQSELQFVNRDPVTSTSAGDYSDIVFEAIVEGPIHVNANTLTSITNSVAGWNSVANPEDGVVGALIEEDGDYKIRQEDEIYAGGTSTTDAIEAKVLRVPGVQQCTCYENVTMLTNSDGVPPKAIEVVIFDGIIPGANNNAIAQAIWDAKAPGETYGTTYGAAIDKKGRERVIYFSRATIRNVYLTYFVKVDATRFPPDGVARIKDAAVLKGDDRNQDEDVIALAMRAAVLQPIVPGVTDVTELRLGFAASPTNTENLEISVRERADFDTSRISVILV